MKIVSPLFGSKIFNIENQCRSFKIFCKNNFIKPFRPSALKALQNEHRRICKKFFCAKFPIVPVENFPAAEFLFVKVWIDF